MYMVEVLGILTLPVSTQTELNQIRPPSGFYEPYISTTMRVIILKQELKDAHFSKLQFIKFSKQSNKPSEHEIYPNRNNFEQFLNKLTFTYETIRVINMK